MTKLKNVFLLVAMAVSAGFVGCDKEDDGEKSGGGAGSFEIKASNVSTGTVEVDSVKGRFWSNENQKEYVVASAPYKDGGFTLILPATIDKKYLNDLSEDADVADVKGGDIYNGIAAYKSGKRVGTFWFVDKIDPEPTKRIIWIYANKTHTTSDGLLLEQGWFQIYWTYSDSGYELTTTQPGGMEWFFIPE